MAGRQTSGRLARRGGDGKGATPDSNVEHAIERVPARPRRGVSCAAVHESESGTFVWTGRALQAEFDDLEMIGLALLYPALERSVCAPGHHGYPRASDLILRKALKGR